jgi:probable HAF family extracellular repeat protein
MRPTVRMHVSICSGVLAIVATVSAQVPKPAQYSVTDLGTLGGAYSYSYAINNAGAIAGGAATPDQVDGVAQTAFIWYRGKKASLGTLGGPACPECNSENAAVSIGGISAVLSETGTMDPNGEDFCGFGTHRQCLAGEWRNGALRALPTLAGGSNSQAYFINDLGEAVGFSETGQTDSNCAMPSQMFRFQGVKWGTNGTPKALRPLDGDTVSFALGINDLGQAVGVSGLCSDTTFPPNNVPGGSHAVIWDANGRPRLIDALPGAVGNNVASSINNRGDVVGNQAISDGTDHGFLWNKATGLTDLMVPGAFVTVIPCCHSINDSRQITGFAIDENGPHGFVWQNGTFTDLNAVLAAGSPWYVFNTASINSAGQIAATGMNVNTGEVHAVLLSPLPANGAPVARGSVHRPALPAAMLSRYQRGK